MSLVSTLNSLSCWHTQKREKKPSRVYLLLADPSSARLLYPGAWDRRGREPPENFLGSWQISCSLSATQNAGSLFN